MTSLPDNLFLSAGAMKAGTTWMYQALGRHPQVYFCPEKEIHYFAHAYVEDEAPLGVAQRLQRARAHATIDPERHSVENARLRLLWTANFLSEPVDDLWYRNLFAFRGRQIWMADFSNLYSLLEPDAWCRIKGDTKRLRVLYTMRDPLERLWSHLKFHLAFTGDRDAMVSLGPDTARDLLSRPFMWKHFEYGDAVRRLRGGLGENELQLGFFEDVHANPAAWLRGVEAFLGVGHHAYPDDLLIKRVNASSSKPMPDWFVEMYAPESERLSVELRGEGLEPPPGWGTRPRERAA